MHEHRPYAITAALAQLSERELGTLIENVPPLVPDLLAWIEHAAEWETERRHGRDSYLQSPAAAIDPGEHDNSATAATILCSLFVKEVPPVSALFDAIAGELAGGTKPH